MARNKYETLESIEKKLSDLEEKRKELNSKKLELADKDNTRLGKLVRSTFRKYLPVQKSEQALFLKAVLKTYENALKTGVAVDWHELADVKSKVSGSNGVVSHTDVHSDIHKNDEIEKQDVTVETETDSELEKIAE